MFRTRLIAVFVGALVALGAFAAHANVHRSVLINKQPIRARLKALVNGNSLRLGRPQLQPHGISALAFRKAKQTAQGFNSFNFDAKAKNFVLGHGRPALIVTTAVIDAWYRAPKLNYFVARDGTTGQVAARGFVENGKIFWTRSKNERGKRTPSERNAAR